jgi:PKD repeat protein
MKKIILGFIVVLGLSGGLTHAWEDCNNYTGDLKQQCEDDTKGRNFVEEITVNVAGALRDVEEFNLRMQYYLRPYVEADLSFSQWRELYGYSSFGMGPIPTGSFELPDAGYFGEIGANTDLRAFILNVLNWVLSFLGLIAIAVIIFAGYTYVVGGEESNEKAKKMILYAAIGIIVILSSYALVNTLITKTIEGGDNSEVAYVSPAEVLNIPLRASCGEENPGCEIYSLGATGGFAVQEYYDIKVFMEGNYSSDSIRNVKWNFSDGKLYEGDLADNGAVEHSFSDSKWYSVAVMGQIENTDPETVDVRPWNEFIGQVRIWVGDVVRARFSVTPSGQIKPGQSVEFDASSSATVAGSINNYEWSCLPEEMCLDFDTQKIATAEKQKKNFFATFTTPGSVSISLKVKAKVGPELTLESESVEQEIKIQAAGSGMINFSVPNVVIKNIPVELRASGAPTDGSYEWTFVDGVDTGDKVQHTFLEEGVEVVELIAKDSLGNQIGEVVRKNVVVSPAKGTIRIIVPSVIVQNEETSLRGTGAPTDGSYEWTFVDGTDTGDTVLYTFPTVGTEEVSLLARDSVGNQISGIVTKTILVSEKEAGNTPIRMFIPTEIIKGVPAIFKAFGAPEDGSYLWDFGGLGSFDENQGNLVSHTFPAEGIYEITLKGFTNDGTQIGGDIVKKVMVSSIDVPMAIATVKDMPVLVGTITNVLRSVGDQRIFGSASCDEFGTCGASALLTHVWNWNGNPIQESQLSQILNRLGIHVMKLIVTSTTDTTKTNEQTFRIKVENNNPTVDFEVTEDSVLGSGFMRFTIKADDIDGEIVRYRLKASEYGRTLETQVIPTTQESVSTIMDLSSYEGTHEILFEVEVQDSDGGKGVQFKNKTLTIDHSVSSNQPPTVSIFTTPATTGTTNSVFRFFTQAYDPDGDYLTYMWVFPGGQTVFGKSAVHRFDEEGTHAVKVTVTDGMENVSDTEIITIVSDSSGGTGGSGSSVDPNTLVKTSVEPAGSNCSKGGMRIEKGIDDNNNEFLDASEVDTTEYVCNGEGGSGGTDPNTLVKTSVEPAGSNCSKGGMRIEKGIDDNNNEFLDASEVDTTEYVCNGEGGSGGTDPNTLVKTSVEPAGSNCSEGGMRIEKGIDDNNNEFLDASEVDTTEYVCNGEGGSGGTDPNTLVKTSVESAGSNCSEGGMRIEKGIDDNNNEFLDASEVDTTEYICNGEDAGGSSGSGGGGTTGSTTLNKAPQVQISGMSPGNTGNTDTKFSFFSNASDPDGDTLVYEWDFADGSSSTTKNVTHTYSSPGTYQVRLCVSDGVASREVKISVRVVAEGEVIPESSLPPYEPIYHSSPISSVITGGNPVAIISGGANPTEGFSKKIQDLTAAKKQALLQCKTDLECSTLQQQIELLNAIQQKTNELNNETDPVRRQQLQEEIAALLAQSKKLDSNVSLATKVEGLLAMKRKALSECTSQVECERLQKEIDTLLLIQQKIAEMEAETDPVRKQQLRDEILALLAPFESVTMATIEGTTNTTFFLYGQINFETDRPLSIEWETGDDRQFSGQDVAWQYSEPGLYTVTMIVSDGTANVTDSLTIKVD